MKKIKELIVTSLANVHSYITPENKIFFDAVHLGQHNEVKKLLKRSRVNSFSTVGQTPLGYACANLDLEMVNLLLDNGANPNVYKNSPPILYAIETSHNWQYISGLAKDMKAALEKNENNAFLIVKRLIDAKFDINYIDKQGSNILMTAAFCGNYKIVQLLIDLGANTQLKNQQGKNTFHYALMGGNKAIFKMLCDIASLEQLHEYKQQIPEDYEAATQTRDLINTLLVHKKLDEDLVVSKEVKKAIKI